MRQIIIQAAAVYLVSTPHGPRYVRADSAQAARLRAFKVWGAGRTVVGTIGQWAPDSLGAFGYAKACNTVDVMPSKAAHHDKAPALGSFYMPSKAKAARVDNEASRLLALLG